MVATAIILFFLLLLGLLLMKLLHGSDKEQSKTTSTATFPTMQDATVILPVDSTPQLVAQQCYAWYVQYFASTKDWTYDHVSTNPLVKRCFSAPFIQSWRNVFNVSETDPVLISPDYYTTWLSSVTTRIESQLSGTSDVEVTLGTDSQTQVLSTRLERTDAGWQIAAVTLTRQAEGN